MKYLAFILLFSMSAFADTLHFEKLGLTAETAWNVIPSAQKEISMVIEFVNDEGEAVNLNAELDVVLWMPSMNHGSGPTAIGRLVDNNGDPILGSYTVRNMWFLMPGLWEVRVELKKDDVKETKTIQVTI